ncbi:MAG TPA: hypothetical protein VJT31_30760 [Rugosimonospora sp.]|nr:hypothetical protein [Rugosimonospora sp.]
MAAEAQTHIHLLRQPGSAYRASAFVVRIDGREVGRIREDRELMIGVATGRHTVQLLCWSSKSRQLEIELGAGEDVELVCRAESSAVGNNIHIIREIGPEPRAPTASSTPQATTVAGEPVTRDARLLRVLDIKETRRSTERIGDESRKIDNRASAVATTRGISFSHEWTRNYTVHFEQAARQHTSLTAGPVWLNAKADVERAIQRNYMIDTATRQVFEEEITVAVPPGVCVQITLEWKRIWQHGEVHMAGPTGDVFAVEFEVQVGMTFDQYQSDTA